MDTHLPKPQPLTAPPDFMPLMETYGVYAGQHASRSSMPAMHYHLYVEMYYVVHGSREYFIGDRFFRAEAGDTIIIPATYLHRTHGGCATRILIHVRQDVLEQHFSPTLVHTLCCLEEPAVLRPAPEDAERVGRLFSMLCTSYSRLIRLAQEPAQDGVFLGMLFSLLFTLSDKRTTVLGAALPDGRLGETVRYINENFTQIRTLHEIADRYFFSKYHLCHLFREQLGISIICYLNMLKVRRACELLREGSRSITDIAAACGFNSSSYFCKVFREQEGMSPMDYRKKHANAPHTKDNNHGM